MQSCEVVLQQHSQAPIEEAAMRLEPDADKIDDHKEWEQKLELEIARKDASRTF